MNKSISEKLKITPFPELLTSAIIKGSQVCFPISPEIKDSDLIEYMDFKAILKTDVLTSRHLISLFKKNFYRSEVSRVFKQSGCLSRLEHLKD